MKLFKKRASLVGKYTYFYTYSIFKKIIYFKMNIHTYTMYILKYT